MSLLVIVPTPLVIRKPLQPIQFGIHTHIRHTPRHPVATPTPTAVPSIPTPHRPAIHAADLPAGGKPRGNLVEVLRGPVVKARGQLALVAHHPVLALAQQLVDAAEELARGRAGRVAVAGRGGRGGRVRRRVRRRVVLLLCVGVSRVREVRWGQGGGGRVAAGGGEGAYVACC